MSYLNDFVEYLIPRVYSHNTNVPCNQTIYVRARRIVPCSESQAIQERLSAQRLPYTLYQTAFVQWLSTKVKSTYKHEFLKVLCDTKCKPTNWDIEQVHTVPLDIVPAVGYLIRKFMALGTDRQALFQCIYQSSENRFYSVLTNTVMATYFPGQTRKQVMLNIVKKQFYLHNTKVPDSPISPTIF